MACGHCQLVKVLQCVPRGYSLHLWSDGHYSFEERFDGAGAARVRSGDSACLGRGVCSGAVGGGGTGAALRVGDGLACEGVCGGHGGVAVADETGERRGCEESSGRDGEAAASGVEGAVRGDRAATVDVERAEVGGGGSSGGGAGGEATTGEACVQRGPNWQKNVEKRARRKLNKEKNHTVPEWRRKDVRAPFHKGAFADCSTETQRELRETRARMLVERNKAEVVRAEHERRKMEARLSSRVVEQEVETARLRGLEDYEKLVKANNDRYPVGYVETLLSAGVQPSDVGFASPVNSVSPSSSISMVELKKRESALVAVTARAIELESRAVAAEKKTVEMETVEVELRRTQRELSDMKRGQRQGYGFSSWST